MVAATSGRRMDPDRFETLVVHGSLAAGEESMADLAREEDARLEHLPAMAPPIRPWRDARALAGLTGIIRRFRPHLVHTHTAKAGFLGRAAARLAPGSRVIVHTFHGHVLEEYFSARDARLFRRLEAAMARRSDCLVGVSRATVEELIGLGVGERAQYRVIPVGLELDQFAQIDEAAGHAVRDELELAADSIVFTYVGRLVAVKRVDLLLRGFAAAQVDGARLLIAGDGEERSALEALAHELGVREAVRFLGYRRDLPGLLAASDAAVLSSANEGMPVSLIEAAAAGLPAIATDVGGVAEVISAESGILVAPGQADDLSRALVRLAGDRDLRRRMGASGRQRVLARNGADRLARDTAALYLELLNEGS